jgi:hypothetical protein
MKKIKTLLPKDPTDLGKVIPGNPTTIDVTHFSIKIDGTSCLIENGVPYCRYDVKLFKRKNGKIIKTFTEEELKSKLPDGAIPCQEPDTKSGHWPHWIPVSETNPEHQYILEGFKNLTLCVDGTYECIGPKLQGNPHNEKHHIWIHHQAVELIFPVENWLDNTYETFKSLFENFPWEGLVAYNGSDPVAKIRRTDFGFEKCNYNQASTLFNKDL